MKGIVFVVFFCLIASTGFSQVAKGTGIFYFNGPPTLPVNECYDGEVGIDTSSGYWYEYSRDLATWIKAGFRVQLYDTCARPVYTPLDKQSEVVLNSCDSLYRWRSGAWYHLNPGAAVTGWTIAADDADTELITNQTVTFAGAGITSTDYNPATDVLTITSTEVDGSVTNELQTYAHSGTTSYTNTLSDGGGSFTLQASGIVSISNSSGTVTISATEVDGSVTNELQTLANTSDATSHTVTLSNSGGSVQLVEGANVTLTTSGTGSDGIVTIAASSGGGTDLSYSGASSPVTLNSSTGTDVTFTEGGIVTITASGSNMTISATEVDGSVTNELQTYAHSGTTSYTNTLSNGGGSFTLQASGIVSISNSSGTVTISATEVDGSVTNELQTYAHSGTTSYTNTLSNGGGSFTLQAGGIVSISNTAGTVTISATEVDGSVTNELQTLANTSNATSHTVTLSNSGGSVQLVEGSNITLTTTGTSSAGIVTIAATEVDGSVTNEGILGVGAGGATSSVITSNTSGATGVTINVAGILSISETTSSNGGSITITGTEVDGSVTNELQTLANTSNATSHTVTLSNSGGSVQLVEGSNITLTTTGTSSDGIVTIAAASAPGTDLSYSGTSSPVTLNSSTGTDVTFTQGGIVTITASGSNMTISATEVDGSVTNELQTYAHSGTTSYTNTLSNGGGAFTLQAGGIVAISNTAGTVTISATEVDGSITNELQTYAHSGTTSYTNTLSNGGGSFTLQASGIVSISNTSGTVTIGATEVDGSITNELQTLANTSDATSHTVTLSNSGGSVQLVEGSNITLTTTGTSSAGIVTIAAASAPGTDLSYSGTSSPVTLNSSTGTDVTFTQGGIVTITASGSNMTISATEVDGSVTNELQTYAHSGTTSYTNTLSNGGGSFTFQASGIVSISNSSGTVTISATEVDGSVTNELQTISNTSDATSHTVTLSNSGGSVQLVEGANVTLTTSGTGSDGIVTIAAASAPGTDLSFTGASSPVTLNSSTGTDVTFTQGGIVTLSASGTNITISATEVDGSVTNELQTYAHSGTTSYTNTLSNGGGSFTLQSGGIVSISNSSGTVTISATEVDGSVTNELQTYAHSGTTSYTNTLSNGGGSFTLQAGGIVSISNTSGTVTISATEVDGSVTNELQTLANTSNATSHTVTLSNSGGSIQLVEGSNITLTTTGTSSDGIVTIASTAGGITAADNGLTLSGSTVKLGGILNQSGTSIEQPTNDVFRWFGAGKWSVSSWTGFGIDPRNSKAGISGLEGSPTTNSTPTIDAALEINPNNSSGTIQSNSLAFGGYATDADGFWIQSRSGSVPNFQYPLSLQPRGGQMSVGRLTGLSSLVTFTGIGLSGSTAAGSVLLLENSEGNGKTSLALGSGSNNVGGELAMFHATDALRITNRNSTNGTTSIRVALGGETSDVATFRKSSAASLVQFGAGTTSPHSTIQSAGSFATAYLETVGAPTFDETKRTVIYTASTNVSWTLPSTTTCNCPGRELILHHAGTAGTITLSQSISKGNAGNFTTIAPGEWAYIIYGTSGGNIRGYKLTSN